jgi:carboxyl-terminal processing protease
VNSKSSPPAPKHLWLKAVLIAVVFFAIGFSICAGGNYYLSRFESKDGVNTAVLDKVERILKQKYDGDIDTEKQAEGSAAGAVAALGDPYTVYLDEKANKELNNDLKGELSGVGIEVGQKNGRLTVIAPLDGTPAAKAGIRAGDIIAAIDGTDSRTLTIDEAINKIRGQAGSEVTLTIVRGSAPPKEVKITRELISVPSVSYEMKPGGVGYIKLRRFGEDTTSGVKNAITNLKSQGAQSIVLDVRDNPGGYLQSAVDIASQFMSEGVVVEERSKHSKTKAVNAIPGGLFTSGKVVILTNQGSASASEILAGALHDNGRATLVGEKTYGKGSVQEVICLTGLQLMSSCEGPSLKVTVAHWFTPKGVNISKEGIKPDVEEKLDNEDYDANRDPQLQKALELAR